MQVQVEKILDGVPEVSDYLKERIDYIPEEYREQIADGFKSLVEVLPYRFIAELRFALILSGFEKVIRVKEIEDAIISDLPSTRNMKKFLEFIDKLVKGDDYFGLPAAKDRIKERLDDVLKM